MRPKPARPLFLLLAAAAFLAPGVHAWFANDAYDDYANGGASDSGGFTYGELGGGDPNAPAWQNAALFIAEPDPVVDPPAPGGGGGGEATTTPAPVDPTPPDPPAPAPDTGPPPADPAADPAPALDPPPAPPPDIPAPLAVPVAPSATLTASPESGPAPLGAVVAWTSADADSAVLSGAGLASTALAGSQSVTLDAPGTYTFTLAASGPGGQVVRSASVTALPTRLPQVITFTPPAAARYPGPALSLGASASSGLPVDLSLLAGPGRLGGNVLTLTGPGPLTLLAAQSGNAVWLPAPDVTATVNVQAGGPVRRIRFNAAGRDAHVTNQGTAAGSTFIWTDPAGLQLSPWPDFSRPQPAAAGPSNTTLPPVPPAPAGPRP